MLIFNNCYTTWP